MEGDFDLDKNVALQVTREVLFSAVIGTASEISTALVGDQANRQRYRDSLYAPKGARPKSRHSKPKSSSRKPRVKKPLAKKPYINKLRDRKTSSAALGLGPKPKILRRATKKGLIRAGIRSLRRGSASLARFIALRYGAKAIAKYQDSAGRLRRSKRLIKLIREIDNATFMIKGYQIKTSTDGKTPYSCTCPDFSQFSSDGREWLGSKAGPFNPCKHMMAVRDRAKGKWACLNGVCSRSANGIYNTKAECEQAVKDRGFSGGQNPSVNYACAIFATDNDGRERLETTTSAQLNTGLAPIGYVRGKILDLTIEQYPPFNLHFCTVTSSDGVYQFGNSLESFLGAGIKVGSRSVFPDDGNPNDPSTNSPKRCPP